MIRPLDLASDGREAIPLTEKILALIENALRRYARFGSISNTEFGLMLADPRAEIEQLLRSQLVDRVHIKDLPEDV